MRFTVMEKSQSAHCCFEATVLDTTKPDMIGGKHYEDEHGKHYEAVCECFSVELAQLVAAALNELNDDEVEPFMDHPAPHLKPGETEGPWSGLKEEEVNAIVAQTYPGWTPKEEPKT